jgi:hypothetical protein
MKKDESRLFLKRVALTDGDYFRPPPGGSPPKVFGAVTPKIRRQVAEQVQRVASHFKKALAEAPGAAAVARVILKDEALAKTHRPSPLFAAAGCPIVGVGGFGELLVSVNSSTLPNLERAVLTESSQQAIANISTIQTVEPFVLAEPMLEELASAVQRHEVESLKLRLFRHHHPLVDGALQGALIAQLRELGVKAEELDYARGLAIFRLRKVVPDQVRALGRFVGTQSLGSFPSYHVVRPAAQPVGKLTGAMFPPPEAGVDYPIVGVVDTGVDPRNSFLSPWVARRAEYVPLADRDYEHGTFVAGLVVNARALNHGDQRFPAASCRVLDVVALPASGDLGEDELLAILRDVVPKNPDVSVWNLSLAGADRCSDHAFSDLAVALDELQTDHNVTFVLPSGNVHAPPFRAWPPGKSIGDSDRICGPADSARALTVGSIAHRDSASSRVKSTEPSPFSRRGPGPVHVPKPEVTHYGGNCDSKGAHPQIGVLSVDANGNVAESVGTSFAAPTVAAILANVQSTPNEALTPLMAKALVIHSAALGTSGLKISEFPYRGYGIPRTPGDIFFDDPWSATLLFEGSLRAGVDLQRTPFPIPACLRNAKGAFRGELTVTLAYEPPLDASFGAEYCRTNVDLSLGTFASNKKGTRVHSRQVPPFPKRTTASPKEKKLIENGFKWSPIKVYRRSIPLGVNGDTWRLAVAATDRNGAQNAPLHVAMIVTIADIEQQAPVYNDVATAMRTLGWITTDLSVRARARARV